MLIDFTLGFATLSMVCMLAAILFILRDILSDKRSNPRIPALISVVGAILYGFFLRQADIANDMMYVFPLIGFLLCAVCAKVIYKVQQKVKLNEFYRACSLARAESQV